MNGYFALHRTAVTHPVVGYAKNPHYFGAWMFILSTCSFKDREDCFGIPLRPGQMSCSLNSLTKQLCGMNPWWTKDKLRTFLNKLQSEGMVKCSTIPTPQKSHTKISTWSVLTVCNYSKYQTDKTVNGSEIPSPPSKNPTQLKKVLTEECNKDSLYGVSSSPRSSETFGDWLDSIGEGIALDEV